MISEDTFEALVSQNFNSVAGDSVHAKAKRLSETIVNNLGFQVHEKTLTRYYKQYVASSENKRRPDAEIVNVLCRNLGHANVRAYEESINPTQQKQSYKKGYWLFAVLLVGLLIFSIYTYNSLKTSECMTWHLESYISCTCDRNTHPVTGNRILRLTEDNKHLKNLRKLEVSAETEFFKNGKPQVWYGKNHNGELEYFNMLAMHPETGKSLKKITTHMIETHIITD